MSFVSILICVCFVIVHFISFFFFFFNDTATTEIYTLSLHDALPILRLNLSPRPRSPGHAFEMPIPLEADNLGPGMLLDAGMRSEEHTSELQSQSNLVCRLLLEKKKKNNRQFMCT